eukprot:1092867-Rhodomonas_salina.1
MRRVPSCSLRGPLAEGPGATHHDIRHNLKLEKPEQQSKRVLARKCGRESVMSQCVRRGLGGSQPDSSRGS